MFKSINILTIYLLLALFNFSFATPSVLTSIQENPTSEKSWFIEVMRYSERLQALKELSTFQNLYFNDPNTRNKFFIYSENHKGKETFVLSVGPYTYKILAEEVQNDLLKANYPSSLSQREQSHYINYSQGYTFTLKSLSAKAFETISQEVYRKKFEELSRFKNYYVNFSPSKKYRFLQKDHQSLFESLYDKHYRLLININDLIAQKEFSNPQKIIVETWLTDHEPILQIHHTNGQEISYFRLNLAHEKITLEPVDWILVETAEQRTHLYQERILYVEGYANVREKYGDYLLLNEDEIANADLTYMLVRGEKHLLHSNEFIGYFPDDELVLFRGAEDTLEPYSLMSGYTTKLPFNTFYSPDRSFRVTGMNDTEFDTKGSAFHIEAWDSKNQRFYEIFTLNQLIGALYGAIMRPIVWINNQELIFYYEALNDIHYFHILIEKNAQK